MSQLNLEQQRKRAKDLLRAHHEQGLEAAVRIARHLPRTKGIPAEQVLASPFTLSEALFVIAHEAGFASWPKLKRNIEAATRDSSEVLIDAALSGDQDFVAEVLNRHAAAAQNSIYAATAIADQESAFALLAANPKLADQPGGRRAWRPLLYLCYGRSQADEESLCAIARRLLDLGANPSGREPGFSSTHGTTLSEDQALLAIEAAASRRASAKLVRLLLDAGADLKGTTSALLQAVRGDSAEVLNILLDALPSEVSWQVGWALQEPVVRRRQDMVRMLAAHADLPAKNPLRKAINLGRGRDYFEDRSAAKCRAATSLKTLIARRYDAPIPLPPSFFEAVAQQAQALCPLTALSDLASPATRARLTSCSKTTRTLHRGSATRIIGCSPGRFAAVARMP